MLGELEHFRAIAWGTIKGRAPASDSLLLRINGLCEARFTFTGFRQHQAYPPAWPEALGFTTVALQAIVSHGKRVNVQMGAQRWCRIGWLTDVRCPGELIGQGYCLGVISGAVYISLGPLPGLLGIFCLLVLVSGAVISVLADVFSLLACLYLWGEHAGSVFSLAWTGFSGWWCTCQDLCSVFGRSASSQCCLWLGLFKVGDGALGWERGSFFGWCASNWCCVFSSV